MTKEQRHIGLTFWFVWVFTSVFGELVGLIGGGIVGGLVLLLYPTGGLNLIELREWEDLFFNWAVVAGGIGSGIAIGVVQCILLQLKGAQAKWWIASCIAGQALHWGGFTYWEVHWTLVVAAFATVGVVAGAVRGIMQWILLRRRFFQTGLWVLARTVVWAGFALGLAAYRYAMWPPEFLFDFATLRRMSWLENFVLLIWGGIIGVEIIAGIAMVWLLRHPRQHNVVVEEVSV